MKTCTQPRKGFTLIELLIVMGLMAVLASLMIAFFPNAATSAREARAAADFQGWLTIAKQRALRDQSPRGLRLWVAPLTIGNITLPQSVVACQYLEQPDDFSVGKIASGSTPDIILFDFSGTSTDLLNGYPFPPLTSADVAYWTIQPGDYIEVMGSGLMHVIVQVTGSAQIQVAPPLANPITTATSNYRIIRTPRPVGDETLKLPADTLIDLTQNANYQNPLPPSSGPYVDVMFAPSGEVITRGVSTPNMHFWVRSLDDFAPLDPFRGDPTIVSVFVRTGFIGAYTPSRFLGPYFNVN